MLKTIKTTKQMRLDELIKYVWESNDEIYNGESIITFKSKDGHIAEFVSNGTFQSDYWFDFEDTFPVEVEELIDENTHFNFLIGIDEDDFVRMDKDITISEMAYADTESIYALISGKLELVWEREEE